MANYRIAGKVTELDVPVARRVKAFKGDKTDFNSLGEKVGDTVSDPSGTYSVPTGTWQGKTFVVAIDDELPPDYDPGAIDWADPELEPGPTFYYSRGLYDTPQAFWQLDDTAPTVVALDASPALLHGTYVGSPGLEQADTPYLNSGVSVQFAGTTQMMTSPSVLSPIAGANFCLEFPFKTAQSGAQVLFASRSFTYPNINYTVLTINQQGAAAVPGHITLHLADGTLIDTFNTVAPELIGDNEWHHLVVIKQGATIMFIYDGKTLAVAGALTVIGPTHEGSPHVFARAPDSAPGGGLAGKLFAIPIWFAAQTPEQAKIRFFLLRRPAQPYTNRVFNDVPGQFHVLEEDAADTVVLDLAGLDQHGAYVGGATPGSVALCWEEPMATSMLVNGVGQRAEITLPFSSSVETTEFTIECWFKTTRTQKAYILDRQNNTNRVAIILNEGAGGAEVAGQIQCFISPAPGLVYRVYLDTPIPTISNDEPHCLGVIYDHPNIAIVLDGVERLTTGTITASTVLMVPAEVYYIGASYLLDAATGFVGNISHFSIWDIALSTTIVKDHYQAQLFGYEGAVVGDTPETYWRLNEASAPIDDTMGNYSNLPVTGSPTFGEPSLLPNDPGNDCIDFEGTSQVTTFNGPIIHNRAEWSLEAWIRIDAFPAVSSVVLGQADSAGNNIAIFVRPGTDRIECALWDGTSWFLLPLNAEVGRLYYIVFTKDATGLKAYVNGSEFATNPTTNNGDTRTQFTIGFDENPAAGAIDAECQHLACYYYAMTQDQAITHFEVGFHQGLLSTIKALLPDGVWPMSDQLNAVEAVDFSINKSHGTYASGALGGGPSLIASEAQQLSATLQAANNSRVQVPAIFSDAAVTAAYTFVYFLQTTNTSKCYILDRADQAGVFTRRAVIELGAQLTNETPNYVQVNHRGDASGADVHTRAPFDLLTDGTVHMVAVVYDDTAVKIYVDGMQLTVDGFMPGPEILNLSNTLDTYFGARVDLFQAQKFVGDLSFIGAWDGVPLDTPTIESIYTAAGYVIPADNYETAVLALLPDGYWPLQEKDISTIAFEASGNAGDGDYVDAVAGGTGLLKNLRDGRSAVISSTQTSRVEIPNIFSNPVNAYTVALWFSTTTSAGRMDVWDNGATAATGNQILVTLNVSLGTDTAGYISVYHQLAVTGSWLSTTVAYPEIYDGNPHHLAVIFDGGTTAVIVLDGKVLPVTGSLPSGTDLTKETVMQIGASRYLGSANDGFIGNISDFALWFNTALTEENIRYLYKAAGAGMDRGGYTTAVLADAPDSFWECQEDAPATTLIDSSGNGNDGSYQNCDGGGISLIPNRLDLSSTIFSSAQNEELDIPSGFPTSGTISAYSFEFWFQTDIHTRRQYLWDKEGGGTSSRISVILNATFVSKTLAAGYISAAHTREAPSHWVNTVEPHPQIYDGKPHHLVVIYAAPNFIFLLDGESVAVTNPILDVGQLNDSTVAVIGQHRSDNASGFEGYLSHCAVWFSEAITSIQGQNHYAASGGLPFVDRFRVEVLADSPDSFWEMQESSPATTLVDSSGNGNNGSYSGADGEGQFSLLNEPLSDSAEFLLTNDALTVPNGIATGVATTAYTFEFWFRTTNSTSRMFLWDKKGGTSTNRLVIVLNASESNTTLDAGKISVVQNTADPDTWVSTNEAYALIYDGQPHHLAIIYNEPDLQILLDGVLLPLNHDFGVDIGILNDQVDAYIGRHMTDTSAQFLGEISNYAAWFDTALSVADVQRHYRAGGGVL